MKIYNSVTQNCNLNCTYCIQSKFTTQCDLKVSYSALDRLPDSGEMVFFGGEPLLKFKEILNTVDYLNSSGKKYKFSLITNGKLLTMPVVKILNKLNITTTISWDGGKSEELRGFNVLKQRPEEYFSLDSLS